MSRRGDIAATVAALMVACCVASVMSRNLLLAAHTSKDSRHTHHTNSLKEEEVVVAGRRGEAALSRLQQQHQQQLLDEDSLDYVFGSEVDSPGKAQRLLEEELDVDPEVTPELFQGDMMVLDGDLLRMSTRVAIKWDKFPERRWANATVPYVISDLYESNEREMIMRALHTLDFLTCIKFVPWDSVEEDYLLIWPMDFPRGCWSYVGRKGGKQIVSLQRPDSRSKRCFESLGKPIHELLHALGMFHEQARPDRDDYIDIIHENIISRFTRNFCKQSADNTSFPFSYDYRSVMHYGKYFFSLFKTRPTIVPKKKGATIGQRIMLSKLDCLKLNDLYGCLDDPFDKEKYTAFCMFLGY